MNGNPNNIHTYTRNEFQNKYNTSHTLNLIPKIHNFKIYFENIDYFGINKDHIIQTDECVEINKDNVKFNLGKLLSLLQKDATIEPISSDDNNNEPIHMLNKSYTEQEIKKYELNMSYINKMNKLLDDYNTIVSEQQTRNETEETPETVEVHSSDPTDIDGIF